MSEVVGRDHSVDPDNRQVKPVALRLWDRRSTFAPFAVAGAVGVIAGGLLAAAIAAPAPTRHGVWSAAYLVLVLGAGQIILGAGQALLSATPPAERKVAITALAYNTANIAILVGIVTGHLIVFDAGAVLLLVALVLFLHGVRHGARRGWPLYVYRLFIAILVVSIPIGLLITTAGAK
ncbi:MAG TPA: hypothetical protein VFQ37_01335 [Mycobacterium sp.]|nr:hypothetical protein [Mycobacterium sp.]